MPVERRHSPVAVRAAIESMNDTSSQIGSAGPM
jgi:hypothetical protein